MKALEHQKFLYAQPQNFKFVVRFHGQMIYHATSQNKAVFAKKLHSIPFQKGISVYLLVTYGKHIDVFGNYRTFYNDGDYTTKQELIQAFKAFMET